MKDAGLRIRVQRELREQFVNVCRAQDKAAAQVLREFMRHYVDKNFNVVDAARDGQSDRKLKHKSHALERKRGGI